MARRAREPGHLLTVREHAEPSSTSRRPVWLRRNWAIVAISIGVAVVVVAGLIASVPSQRPTLSASSTSTGTSANALLDRDGSADRRITWRSAAGMTTGTTLTMRWPGTISVDHILWHAPESATIRSGLLRFTDGSTLLVTAGRHGDVDVGFAARAVSSATLTVTAVFAHATSVSLASLDVNSSGSAPVAVGGDAASAAHPSASSSAPGTSPAALVDAARQLRDVASSAEWSPAQNDTRPWIQLRWNRPVPLTSIQVYGPSDAAAGPARATLQFSDGSEVQLGALRGGTDEPTTVGFATRTITSVRLQMSSGAVALREIAAFDVGSTPPQPQESPLPGLGTTPAASCSTVGGPTSPPKKLALLCPSPGSAVEARASVVVALPPSKSYTVSAWVPLPGAADQGSVQTVAQGKADAAGVAKISVDATRLLDGPLNLEVDSGGLQPLAVQLINASGLHGGEGTEAVAGRTLLFADDFSDGLSASASGARTRYSVTKPTYQGPAEFGNAMFENPEWNTGNVGEISGGYLRMRLSPAEGRKDAFGYGRTQIGAMLSSAALGGGGISSQYGYFEARMLGAPGVGTWPAFWMLSGPTVADPKAASGEVDTVELYGHDLAHSCHSVHSYTTKQSKTECIAPLQLGNWALQWHTYGADITADGTDFYIDGHLITHEAGPSNADSPYFFLLNLASGGGWPVDLSSTGGIADMYVDWVRVYS